MTRRSRFRASAAALIVCLAGCGGDASLTHTAETKCLLRLSTFVKAWQLLPNLRRDRTIMMSKSNWRIRRRLATRPASIPASRRR